MPTLVVFCQSWSDLVDSERMAPIPAHGSRRVSIIIIAYFLEFRCLRASSLCCAFGGFSIVGSSLGAGRTRRRPHGMSERKTLCLFRSSVHAGFLP